MIKSARGDFMSAPKISVLIPLYNRKQYAADCINSVLNQSFQDFEIIIRDDYSTDGVFEFVRENFSDRRIKFFRNEKNLGEAATLILLAQDAAGKYFTILHNDDLYLKNVLKNFYETAENFGADIVHGANLFISGNDGIISKDKPLRKISFDKLPVQKIEILRDDSNFRFNEWFEGKVFRDLQYNIFRRKFILDEKIFSDITRKDLLAVSLKWIMKAKILVKTPESFYIRRENPYTQSNAQIKFEEEFARRIENFRWLEKFISEFEFLRDNEILKYKIKARFFGFYEDLNFDNSSFGNEKFAEVYKSIENNFRKYFGEDAAYLALTYHWAHSMHFNQNQLQGILKNCLNLLERKI